MSDQNSKTLEQLQEQLQEQLYQTQIHQMTQDMLFGSMIRAVARQSPELLNCFQSECEAAIDEVAQKSPELADVLARQFAKFVRLDPQG